jgi:sugar phosphate isomerase/epimerase
MDRARLFIMYSFSTCWNSQRHTDGRAMLREIHSLGFDYAELSHGIRMSLLPGIFEAVDAGEMKISSLHNFCPLPMGVTHAAPNLYKFSSANPRERENAWRHTLKTIETAVRVRAQAVVLHLGDIEMKDYTEKLLELVKDGQRGTPKYEKICAELMEKREVKKIEPMDLIEEVLARLATEAEARGLKLGIENRASLEELPLEDDFGFLLREFNRPGVGYWHDTGHAQIKENLGFISHPMHLQFLVDRIVGFHIHDVEFPGHDHQPPGRGMIDFAALKPSVKPHHIKVFEFSPRLTEEEAREGVAFIKQLWGGE